MMTCDEQGSVCRFGQTFLLVFLLALGTSACTTLTPVEMAPGELHQTLRENDDVVNTGDRIKVVLDDGTVHKFKVVRKDDKKLYGKQVDVDIDRIVAFESREFSLGKTALLTGGVTATVIAIGVIVAAPALIYAGGG